MSHSDVKCSWLCQNSPGAYNHGMLYFHSGGHHYTMKSNSGSGDSVAHVSMHYSKTLENGHVHSNTRGSSKESHHTHDGLVSSSHIHGPAEHCHYICSPVPCASSSSFSKISSSADQSNSKVSGSESKSGKVSNSSFNISMAYSSITRSTAESKYGQVVSSRSMSTSKSEKVHRLELTGVETHVTSSDMTSPIENNFQQDSIWHTEDVMHASSESIPVSSVNKKVTSFSLVWLCTFLIAMYWATF